MGFAPLRAGGHTRAVRYLNNAGTSWPKPPEVLAAATRVLGLSPAEATEIFDAAHARTCAFMGITTPERFLFTPGCTAALGVVFADLPWQEGDIIVTSSLEHHALARPVSQLVSSRGVVHRAVGYRRGVPIDLDEVESILVGGRVRLVAVTGASNVTGEVLPIRALADLAHGHGAMLLLDAAQTLGVSEVNVEALGADIVVFAGHKGPLGPVGVGGLWAAPGVGFESPWATCEIATVGGARAACSTFPQFCDVGSANMAAIAGLHTGLGWIEAQGREHVYAHGPGLAARLRGELARHFGDEVRLFGEPGTGMHTATLSMSLRSLPLAQCEEYFAARDLVVRAGQHCAPMALEAIGAPRGTLRLSFGPFSETEDVDRVLSAIDEL